MKNCYFLIVVALLLSACTPSASNIQTAIVQTQVFITQTQLAIARTQTFVSTLENINTITPSRTSTRTFTKTPSQTLSPTFTLTPSMTASSIYSMTPSGTATRTLTMTPTQTASPTFTTTFTNTPTLTWTPTITPNPLNLPRGDGYYLIYIEIAPGIWRNDSTDQHCYWETTSRTGTIINSYFGPGGGTADISPGSYAFQSRRCGTWTFLKNP